MISRTQRGLQIAAISASTASRRRGGCCRGPGGRQLGELRAGLGQGLVQAAGLAACRVGEWVSTARRVTPSAVTVVS